MSLYHEQNPHMLLQPGQRAGTILQVPGCTWAGVTGTPDLALDGAQVLGWGVGEPLHRPLHVLLPDAHGAVQAFADNFKIFNRHLQEGCR